VVDMHGASQVLLSEVMPWKLEMMDHVDAWVQVYLFLPPPPPAFASLNTYNYNTGQQ